MSQQDQNKDQSGKVAVVMGSQSDWPIMKHAVEQLEAFGVAYQAKVVSAHRTPELLYEFADSARANGFSAIIAGAGGAAHLPGMLAAKTTLPVLGVPVPSKHLKGMDSLLSIVQMPKGIPVATVATNCLGASAADSPPTRISPSGSIASDLLPSRPCPSECLPTSRCGFSCR